MNHTLIQVQPIETNPIQSTPCLQDEQRPVASRARACHCIDIAGSSCTCSINKPHASRSRSC